MKRIAIALSIIAVLGMFSPCFSAQPIQVPHENPATTQDSLDTVSLLLSYSNIFNLAADRQYQDALEILNELSQTELPDELRYIIDLYGTRGQQLFTMLNDTKFLLDEAETLVSKYHIEEAREKLGQAEAIVMDSGSLLKDIATATDILSDRLHAFAVSPIRIRQVHGRLTESLNRVRQLIYELNYSIQSFDERSFG
ncbi:hypothetical protein ACFLUO_08540 [Chloroflexota bacterium]